MVESNLKEFLSDRNIEEIKNVIFYMIEQIFPAMDESEKKNFILKLIGESGHDKLSSMAGR